MVNNFTDKQELIYRMQKGDRDAIINGLNHEGSLLRINGIINFARYRMFDTEIIELVISLENDKSFIDGFYVSDFATAALDIVGIKIYYGENENINRLIKSKFEF